MAAKTTKPKARTGTIVAAKTAVTAPPLGQVTKGKAQAYGIEGMFDGLGLCPGGSYETYRQMRADPTVAIARAAATAPIKAATWSVEADGDGYDEAVEYVQDMMSPLMGGIKREACRAFDYGNQPAELVWGLNDSGRIVLDKFKPLLPDGVKHLTDEYGTLIGLRSKGADLMGSKAFLHTYDGEGGDTYGRSRMENLREHAWKPWTEIIKKQFQYFTKAAGIIPIVSYPPGQSPTGDTGQTIDHGLIAQKLLADLGKGFGVCMPNTQLAWVEDQLRQGVDPKSLAAWTISFLESKGGAGSEFDLAARYYDTLKVRGWLMPERSILEGQHGTLAEADSHADTAVLIAEEDHGLIIDSVNAQIVYPALMVNFGEDAARSVRLKGAPLVDSERAIAKNLITSVLTAPANVDLFLSMLDFDAMLDQVGLPKLKAVVDANEPNAGGVPIDPAQVMNTLTTTPGPVQDSVQQTALNGAQVTSMVTLATEVANRRLPADAVKAIMKAAFPAIPEAIIDQIINSVAGFTPPPAVGALARTFSQSMMSKFGGRKR